MPMLRRFFAFTLAAFLHIAMLDYLLYLEPLRARDPEATSIKLHILADLHKSPENPRPFPLNFSEPVTDVAAPDVEMAPPRETYKAPSVQMIDNLAPHSDEIIIATTGPRPIPNAPNAFP